MQGNQNLKKRRQEDIPTSSSKALVNIEDVHLSSHLPSDSRILDYCRQIQSPYCFLCRDTPVKIRFQPDGEELSTVLTHYFLSLKRNSAFENDSL